MALPETLRLSSTALGLFETAGGTSPALRARDRAARTACARLEEEKNEKEPHYDEMDFRVVE